jgi:hypothetical protein
MNNTIEITLPGIEAKLDRIIELLETAPHCADCAKDVAQDAVSSTAAALRQAAQERTEDGGEVNTPSEEETPTAATEANDAPPVKREDVQKKVVELSAAGKKDAVKAVVTAYAKNVSGIPEDKLAEVLDKLTALEG